MQLKFSRYSNVYILTAIFSVLVLTWINYQFRGLINTDSILYLEVAKIFSDGTYCESYAKYVWPFFSFLIAFVHQLTHLSLHFSAQILTILLWTGAIVGSARLVRELGGREVALFSIAILILCSPYLVDSTFHMILREHAFIFFLVWALFFLLRFYKTAALKYGLLWGVFVFLSMLFRIEAITFLVLMPLVLLLKDKQTWSAKILIFIKANIVSSLLLLSVFIWKYLGGMKLLCSGNAKNFQTFGRVGEFTKYIESFRANLGKTSDWLRAEVETSPLNLFYSEDFFYFALAAYVIYKVIISAGILQFFIALASKLLKLKSGFKYAKFVNFVLLLSTVNALVIFISVQHLPSRYLLPAIMVILIYASISFEYLYNGINRTHEKNHLIKAILIIIVILTIIQSLILLKPKSEKIRYEYNAVQYVLSHSVDNTKVYYGSGKMRYYANGDTSRRKKDSIQFINNKLITGELKYYDYILINVPVQNKEIIQNFSKLIGAKLIKKYDNGKNDHVLIFRND